MDDNEELKNTIKEVQKKLDTLSTPYEEALANRVFDKSQERFKKWMGVWLGVITLGLVFMGLKGFEDLAKVGNEKATNFIANEAQKKLEARIDTEVNKSLEGVKERIDAQIANRVRQIDEQIADSIVSINNKETRGYVTTGYFKKISGSSGSTNVSGDVLKAIANVNMRHGNPNNISDFLSWTVIKTLPNGTDVRVLKTYTSNNPQYPEVAEIEVIKQ